MKYTECKICGAAVNIINEKHRLQICINCDLIFFEESLDDNEIEKIYDNLYNKTSAYETHIHQQTQLSQSKQPKLGYNKRWVLKQVLLHHPKHICEIGAGVGVVANYLMKRGYEYTGFELDAKTAEKAKNAGLNIHHDTFDKLEDLENSFDLVVAFEVIEHIDNLKKCIALISKALKEKGLFALTVPNYDKRKSFDDDADKLYQTGPPVHVNFFTAENLRKVLQTFNLEIVYIKKRPFPNANFIKKLFFKQALLILRGQYEGATIMCIAKKI